MKCPVCKNECLPNDSVCTTCGFTELHVEFINAEEAKLWERSVLRPCKALWNASQSMYETALRKYQSLLSQSVLHIEDNIEAEIAFAPFVEKQNNNPKAVIMYEDEYARIEFSDNEVSSAGKLRVNCIAINKSSKTIAVALEGTNCNGWDVGYMSNGHVRISPFGKNRAAFEFSKFFELTGIKSKEQIEELRYRVRISDLDSGKRLADSREYYRLDYSGLKKSAF